MWPVSCSTWLPASKPRPYTVPSLYLRSKVNSFGEQEQFRDHKLWAYSDMRVAVLFHRSSAHTHTPQQRRMGKWSVKMKAMVWFSTKLLIEAGTWDIATRITEAESSGGWSLDRFALSLKKKHSLSEKPWPQYGDQEGSQPHGQAVRIRTVERTETQKKHGASDQEINQP